ncbi:MAG: hypothetical protein ACI87N_001655, partial [Flavobacteriales bacterium]
MCIKIYLKMKKLIFFLAFIILSNLQAQNRPKLV